MWKQVVAALLLLTGTTGNFSTNAQSITDGPVKLDGRVYTLRGDMGIFFSRGMDHLAAELNQLGLTAGVYNWLDWIALADDAIARYRAAPDRTRILLAGHSRGGDGLIAMAWRLYSAGVPVALAVAFDFDSCSRSGPTQCGTFHQPLSIHQRSRRRCRQTGTRLRRRVRNREPRRPPRDEPRHH